VNETLSKRIVLVSMMGMLGVSLARKSGSNFAGSFQKVYAVTIVGLVLSLIADIAPSIAGWFSLLVFTGYLTPAGQQAVYNLLSKATGGQIGAGGPVPPPSGVGVTQPSGSAATSVVVTQPSTVPGTTQPPPYVIPGLAPTFPH
jgi:hypothetical protein